MELYEAFLVVIFMFLVIAAVILAVCAIACLLGGDFSAAFALALATAIIVLAAIKIWEEMELVGLVFMQVTGALV